MEYTWKLGSQMGNYIRLSTNKFLVKKEIDSADDVLDIVMLNDLPKREKKWALEKVYDDEIVALFLDANDSLNQFVNEIRR